MVRVRDGHHRHASASGRHGDGGWCNSRLHGQSGCRREPNRDRRRPTNPSKSPIVKSKATTDRCPDRSDTRTMSIGDETNIILGSTEQTATGPRIDLENIDSRLNKYFYFSKLPPLNGGTFLPTYITTMRDGMKEASRPLRQSPSLSLGLSHTHQVAGPCVSDGRRRRMRPCTPSRRHSR